MLREDVVTIDEFLMEYERDILTINGKTWDIKQDSEAHQRFKKIAAKVASETFNQTSFYDLHAEQKTPKGYVACLRKCDTFPTDYKDEFLER
ncbi:hypothetical protein H8356DRAFT_946484 [Neocallimastix lanati (nom. inval.)]|nr:hypothetical protein H8356DRAFT_946484 [Neocallimastix sp. JGI-2020a]